MELFNDREREFWDETATEDLNKGRIRLRGNLVAPFQAFILCIIDQHLNAIKSYSKKPTKKGVHPYARQIDYRNSAIAALTHAMALLGQPVKRRLFWEAADKLWEEFGPGPLGGPDSAA